MKKVLSLLLVAILVLGMSSVSFAATKSGGYVGTPTVNDFSGDLEADASVAWQIPQLQDVPLATAGVTYHTAKAVKAAKVTVKSSLKSGSKFLDEVKIDDAQPTTGLGTTTAKVACVVFNIVDPFVSTGDVDYNYTFYLAFDGKQDRNIDYHAEAQIIANTVPVDADTDYVDLSDGLVADVSAYVKAIEVDLGNGVILNTKLYNGKKYFGVASTDVSEDDDAIMSKYPSIDQVITLTTIGLNAAGNIVTLEDCGDGYVYDKDMKYLGRANEKLPYSTKYYISTIEIVSEDEVGEGDAPEDGEGEAPANANDNPETGR